MVQVPNIRPWIRKEGDPSILEQPKFHSRLKFGTKRGIWYREMGPLAISGDDVGVP
jgi:hypothetical protein